MNDFKVFLAGLVAQHIDSPNAIGAVRFNRHDGRTEQRCRLPHGCTVYSHFEDDPCPCGSIGPPIVKGLENRIPGQLGGTNSGQPVVG